jgi:hypothetical protein
MAKLHRQSGSSNVRSARPTAQYSSVHGGIHSSDTENFDPTRPTSMHKSLCILLMGLAIFWAVALLSAGLLVPILILHDFYFTPGAIVTSAPLGPTLAIAHASSSVVSLTVPIVMGLAAYHLSGDWLAASCAGGDDRPTPFQYVSQFLCVIIAKEILQAWNSYECPVWGQFDHHVGRCGIDKLL